MRSRLPESAPLLGAMLLAAVILAALAAPLALTHFRQPAAVSSGAKLNVAYPYQLLTHCGVLLARFDGRWFYLESLYPNDVPADLDHPQDVGTMVLLSQHLAVFSDAAGHVIRFVDSPPGEIGKPYPFTVHVVAGGNLLSDEAFAGRIWQAQGTLPGVPGPAHVPGRADYTVVGGTFTLKSGDRAVFTSSHAKSVAFVRRPLVPCD